METKQKVGKVLGELELEIMEIIWQSKGSLSVRQVIDLIRQKRPLAYTTVMTIMNRLVDKKLLKRRSYGKVFVYQAAVSKDNFLAKVSKQIIKNFVSSFGETAIAHFAEEVDRLAPTKRQELLKMLRGYKK
ncbi:MAG: hypothetical protein US86_C0001G0262 [Candidatus Daviesbacteria bacterium GW2011_GWA2_38_24]|uniref:Transcriptional repressor, CopY family n=1 Tax=Candidatus Daviesbacteria bacterium GW2011_GWA2_38_24 TaxID=1618422 RepID=A0A0G0JW51_9BACT|nr:MAG: hypothetical protein US86_C0001G0262 [Candidatus Daviesbacteria bacterium GW2011_GWA2_38_24]KKQ80383.1 MAG: hypothetical protein UT01_C0013G0006 [Candidatus Daviesbacteria bacterium GW2011_GWA1_38_7]OGE24718.1 MAG: hypothetical protein A2688_01780 [Candidatus Daviesbacteria bacterium RIFCSPHIGHO2_01_FULL_38_8]